MTSRCVTPISFFGSYTPRVFKTSAAIGTVELTGLEMTRSIAAGACVATAAVRSRTMPALTLKRSSRVIPGFRGTPAGIRTTSAPWSAAPSCVSPTKPSTRAALSTCETSAATPFASGATSKRRRLVTIGWRFMRSDSGWPIPPAAPRIATANPPEEEGEGEAATGARVRWRVIVATRRAAHDVRGVSDAISGSRGLRSVARSGVRRRTESERTTRALAADVRSRGGVWRRGDGRGGPTVRVGECAQETRRPRRNDIVRATTVALGAPRLFRLFRRPRPVSRWPI